MWIDALTKFKFSCYIFLFRSLPAHSFRLSHQFHWEKVFAKSKDLANFLESKTPRFKISINSVLHVALLVFSIPEKPENEHSTVFCDKLHFFSCCDNLNMAMGSCIVTQNRFSALVTGYVGWVFLELKLRKKKKKFHTKHCLVSVLPVKSGVTWEFAFNCALLFKYR